MEVVRQALPYSEQPQLAEDRQEVMSDKVRKQVLEHLSSELNAEFLSRTQERDQVERRWLDDLRHYNSQYLAEDEAKLRRGGSSVFYNVTRPKANAIEARLIEMATPQDERPFGIEPSAVPELQAEVESLTRQQRAGIDLQRGSSPQEQGEQPQTAEEIRLQEIAEVQHEAEKRSKAMEAEIEDHLQASRYQALFRKVLHDGVVYGTGVLRGPIIHLEQKRRWRADPTTGIATLQFDESTRPGMEYVDLWGYYPEIDAEDADQVERHYHRRTLTRVQLAALAQNPTFIAENIALAIQDGPSKSWITEASRYERMYTAGVSGGLSRNTWEVVSMEGAIEPEWLRANGYEVAEELENPLLVLWGEVTFCGPFVIRVKLHPWAGSRCTYGVWNWEPDEATIFGYGVPYRARNGQRAVNAAWRAALDNAGLSVGPMLFIKSQFITPLAGDGDYELRPLKIFDVSQNVQDIRTAVQELKINSNVQEIAALVEMGKSQIDDEVGVPRLASGELGSQNPNTAQATSILHNNASIVLRRAMKSWDDVVTPLVERFYDYLMEHSPKEYIKGDMQAVAKGSSVMLVRETQQQAIAYWMSLVDSSPTWRAFLDPAKLAKVAVNVQGFAMADLMRSPIEIADQLKVMEQRPDPAQIAAEIEQSKMRAAFEDHERDRMLKSELALLARDTEMMKLAAAQNTTVEKIAADLQKARDSQAAETQRTLLREQAQTERHVYEGANKILGNIKEGW